jgi:hypothetical protein
LRLLSCYQAVGGLRLAGPAQPFATLRSDKNPDQHVGSTLRAGSLQLLYGRTVTGKCNPSSLLTPKKMTLMLAQYWRLARRVERRAARSQTHPPPTLAAQIGGRS